MPHSLFKVKSLLKKMLGFTQLKPIILYANIIMRMTLHIYKYITWIHIKHDIIYTDNDIDVNFIFTFKWI